MPQLKNMAILIVIAVAAAILQSTEATDYTVGDSTGWISSPTGGASFYSNWASNITFRENDTLVFRFTTGRHTVAELTKANFGSCNVNQNIQVFTTSPVRFTLNRTGEFYFACSIPGHCSSGQKLSVRVNGSSPAPRNAPPPSSGTPPSSEGSPTQSPPTEPGATPPSPGSATSLAATFSLLFTVVINLLF
ncbi:cucumber peeling cupredoxin-like [Abrus precatorius]|uniref:Cucumber peeling cupredoxin-like n=1 Tax=Abrus precatorius TaxID=3816 RepID=A0A8B8K897_ABRPR|nr:cucumber peeling cupredoxin-like [Abrus precatorius]